MMHERLLNIASPSVLSIWVNDISLFFFSLTFYIKSFKTSYCFYLQSTSRIWLLFTISMATLSLIIVSIMSLLNYCCPNSYSILCSAFLPLPPHSPFLTQPPEWSFLKHELNYVTLCSESPSSSRVKPKVIQWPRGLYRICSSVHPPDFIVHYPCLVTLV